MLALPVCILLTSGLPLKPLYYALVDFLQCYLIPFILCCLSELPVDP